MEVKSESWRQLPESYRRLGGRSTSRTPGWRRSGDEGYWEQLAAEVEVLPCAPRPQSCIGGVGVEGWLRQLERAQSRPSGAPVCGKVPPLSDRTVSMPMLQGGAANLTPSRTETYRRYPVVPSPYSQGSTSQRTASWYETPPSSEEEFFTSVRYRTLDPSGQWETAHFRCTPRSEQVRFSTLAPVKNGWLPIQRQAVVCDITCHGSRPEDSTHQDQSDPSINTVIIPNYLNNNGFGYTDGKEIGNNTVRANHTDPGTWMLSGQTLPDIRQASGRNSLALAEGDLPLDQGCRRTEREDRKMAFLFNEVPSNDYRSKERAAPCRNPLVRTASAPVRSCAAVPPADMEGPTKMRMGFSSVTVQTQRNSRSPMVPSDPCVITPSNVSRSSTPNNFDNPPTSQTSKPVVHRRRASVIKVAESGKNSCAGETVTRGRPPNFRYSYTEGGDKENTLTRFWLQGGGESVASSSPGACPEVLAGSASTAPHLDRSKSTVLGSEAGRGKVYRSTLSLHLSSPSSNQALRPDSGRGGAERPRRPLSFAGVVRLTDPSQCGLPCLASNQPSCGFLEKTHMASSRDTACNPNAQSSSAGLPLEEKKQPNAHSTTQDLRIKMGPYLHPTHCTSQNPAAVKTQEHGECQSAEAILALNAASVIANIKLQAQLSKMANLISEQDSKKPQGSGTVSVEDPGCHERQAPDEGVVRRAHGSSDRKARPRPVHGGPIWPGSIYDQQECAPAPLTLREALELLRPDFIRRSRGRVQKVEHRARERRARQHSTQSAPEPAQRSGKRTRLTSPKPAGDNFGKVGERATTGKEIQLRSKRNYNNLPEVKRKKEEEKKRAMTQTNRLRAELFKKKLLDQILQRNCK